MFRELAAAALTALLLPTAALAQGDKADFKLFNDIARSVTTYAKFTVFDDVAGSVDHGVVTLTGKVTMPYKATDLEWRVARVPGVTRVKNQIQVLPVSIVDEELRYTIARKIYGNPAFWQYAAMANPPIHIIVENGRVTLTGVVFNDLERILARSLASGTFGAFAVVNDLRTDAEMKALVEKMD
jgi:hyperosmotically inducible periplasmic protein